MLEEGDPTERIVVLRTDLEAWQTAMHWAYGLASSLDLSDNYRAGRPNKESSKLTKLIARSHNRIEGYLADESEPDELLPAE